MKSSCLHTRCSGRSTPQYFGTSLVKAVELKPINKVDDAMLVLADVSRKAIVQVKNASRALVTRHMTQDLAKSPADKLPPAGQRTTIRSPQKRRPGWVFP